MNCTKLFNPSAWVFWMTLLFVCVLTAQNTEVPREIQDLDSSAELVLYRRIMPDNREEMYYLIKGQFFQTTRQVGEPWGKINTSDSVLGIYVMKHWPALRDDVVKPFRLKSQSTAGNIEIQNQNNSPDKNTRSITREHVLAATELNSKDLFFKYVLFYRNIMVEPEFYQKDIDPMWAEENATFTFNQTLKLTKMHQIMDALFLY